MEPSKKPNIDTTRFCMVGGASLFNLTDKPLTTKTTSRKHVVELCPLVRDAAVEKTVNVIHDIWIGTIDELVAKFRKSLTDSAAYGTRQDIDAGVAEPPKEWAEVEQTQKVLAEAGIKEFTRI